jgi:hypothetical protein
MNIKSGVYKIYPDNIKPFNVYCDMQTDGGSWMVSIRRSRNDSSSNNL